MSVISAPLKNAYQANSNISVNTDLALKLPPARHLRNDSQR